MAYIGVQPTAGQYRKLDNISASFNGSTTSFTTSVGGTNVTAGTAQQLIVSLGGVIQQPDTDYTVSTNTITFTTAPTSGLDFFAILMGDALNTVTPSDGSVTTSKLAGSLSVGLADGTVSAPSLFFTGDTNCGLYSPSDDQLAVTTNGVERVEWGTSEVVFNDGGTNYDFRVEGDTNANLLFVDASADAVGIGTSTVDELLHLKGASAASTTLKVESTATASERSSIHFFNGSVSRGRVGGSNDFDGLTLDSSTTESAAAIRFRTGGTSLTTKMTLTSGGSLGIGTTSPGTTTEIRGSDNTVINSKGNLFVADGGTAAQAAGEGGQICFGAWLNGDLSAPYAMAAIKGITESSTTNVNTGALLFGSRDTSSGIIERMRIDSSGRLLVGTSTSRTSSYGFNLEIEATSVAAGIAVTRNSNDASGSLLALSKSRSTTVGGNALVSSGDNLGKISFIGSDGTNPLVAASIETQVDGTPGANDMPGRLVFSVTSDGSASPTERLRIRNNGAANFFAANDTVATHSSATAGTSFVNFAGYHSATNTTDGTNSFLVYTNGNVQNTNGSYTTLSDAKLKENITDAGSQWDDFKAIRIRNWNFKAETGHETHRQIGPIAQELETVCPGLVFETPDRDADGNETGEVTKGVNQSVLYMKAVKALQEAMERIETLEQRLTDAGIV